MALYIVFDNPTMSGHEGWQWHVGEPVPRAFQGDLIRTVVSVQADGDELNYIMGWFTNLPTMKRPVVKWFGDHAKFIVGNLI